MLSGAPDWILTRGLPGRSRMLYPTELVYLSKDLCKLLRAWEKECQWEKEQRGDDELAQDDYLFQQPNGDLMVPCTFTYQFKMILWENGLPDNLNFHSLRHANASMLIVQGVDVRTVAGLLGYAQPSTTLDIYSHAFDKNKRLAGQKLSKAMGLCEKQSVCRR